MITQIWVVLGLISVVFPFENGSHFPVYLEVGRGGISQVILGYILDILNVRSCLLWILLYNPLVRVFCLFKDRQSPWLGIDCRFCLAFGGW